MQRTTSCFYAICDLYLRTPHPITDCEHDLTMLLAFLNDTGALNEMCPADGMTTHCLFSTQSRRISLQIDGQGQI
jgi:hypothetical protein